MSNNNNNTNDHDERERRVLELYDQGKNTRGITKELRMSLRDIGFILKKCQVNHGIVTIMDDGNNATITAQNEKRRQKGVQSFDIAFKDKKST